MRCTCIIQITVIWIRGNVVFRIYFHDDISKHRPIHHNIYLFVSTKKCIACYPYKWVTCKSYLFHCHAATFSCRTGQKLHFAVVINDNKMLHIQTNISLKHVLS